MVQLSGGESYLSIGMLSQYGRGVLPSQELSDTTGAPYIYSEHLLGITAGRGSWSLWTSLELSAPPRIGPPLTGLHKLRLEWSDSRIRFQLGDLYGLFGRGLALNMWEDQDIDWDSTVRGAWLTLGMNKWLGLDLLHGTSVTARHLPAGPGIDPRRRDYNDKARTSAIRLEARYLPAGLTSGLYLVAVKAENPWFNQVFNPASSANMVIDSTTLVTNSYLPGGYLEFLGNNFDAFVELTGRFQQVDETDSLYSTPDQTWIPIDNTNRGGSVYASLSHYPGRWGWTLEYKNYLLDAADPDNRQYPPRRVYRRNSIQSPPLGFKEHSSTLLGRTHHNMDFEDEVGFQIELNWEVTQDALLTFNFARASRHYAFAKVIEPDFSSAWRRESSPNRLWLANDEAYYPFKELLAEIQYRYLPGNFDLMALISRQDDMLSYQQTNILFSGEPGTGQDIINWERRKLLTIPTQITQGLPNGWGLTLHWEHQWEETEFYSRLAKRDLNTGVITAEPVETSKTASIYQRYVAITISRSSRYSLGFVYDSVSRMRTGRSVNVVPGDDNPLERLLRRAGIDPKNKWLGVQAGYYFTPATELTVLYGSIQGGLKCDSGVCIYVPGMEDAITLRLTSSW
ncbi:MAG: hypothetical protein IID13_08450 [Candidatus Marinimicrobia bacterium]|nr:hypothetical protein [Candidatus Neomarinimicrobiota bacterium]